MFSLKIDVLYKAPCWLCISRMWLGASLQLCILESFYYVMKEKQTLSRTLEFPYCIFAKSPICFLKAEIMLFSIFYLTADLFSLYFFPYAFWSHVKNLASLLSFPDFLYSNYTLMAVYTVMMTQDCVVNEIWLVLPWLLRSATIWVAFFCSLWSAFYNIITQQTWSALPFAVQSSILFPIMLLHYDMQL